METKKITLKEKIINNISYYESMIELLEGLKKPTQEEVIKTKMYKNFLCEMKSINRLYNYENGNKEQNTNE